MFDVLQHLLEFLLRNLFTRHDQILDLIEQFELLELLLEDLNFIHVGEEEHHLLQVTANHFIHLGSLVV